MSNNELVSVIIPVYNSEKYLSKCVKSVLNQTYKNIEIILIDDGSKDNSKNICNNFVINQNVKVIYKNNSGVSSARNLGIEKANGRYIIFIDADDYIKEDMIEKMHSEFLKRDVDIVICEYDCYFQEQDKTEHIKYEVSDSLEDFQELIMNNSYKIYGYLWNKMFKKENITEYFNTDIHVKEDLLFILMNYSNSTKYSIIYENLYTYRVYSRSSVQNKKNLKRLSAVEADCWIVENIHNKYEIKYKLAFFGEYFNYWKNYKNNKFLIDKKKIFYQCYENILQSKEIPNISKIKCFIKIMIMKVCGYKIVKV